MSLINNRDNIKLFIIVILLIGAVIGIITITRLGVGASPDSVAYLGAAQNWLDGYGLSLPYGEPGNPPMTHHAPLYPFIIAIGGLFGFSLLGVARWLNILLFVANIGIVFAILRSVTKIIWLQFVGLALIVTSPTMILIHSMAWTESLFLFLALGGFYLLSLQLENRAQIYLYISAILLGLAFLTRYAGVVLVATGFAGILLLNQKPVRRRLIDGVILVVVSVSPTLFWMLRNMMLADTASNREFVYHAIGKTQLIQMVDTFSNWFLLPNQLSATVRGGVLILFFATLIGIIYFDFRKFYGQNRNRGLESDGSDIPSIVNIFVLFIILYLLFLIFSISFIDANTPLDDRILSPLYICGLVLVIFAFGKLIESQNIKSYIKIAISVLLFLVLGVHTLTGLRYISMRNSTGIGFNSTYWRESQVIRAVKDIPSDLPIYTNVPEVVYFYTARPAIRLPKPNFAVTQQINVDYQVSLSQVGDQLRSGNGVVVYFTNLSHSSHTEEGNMVKAMELCLFAEAKDGSIYLPETLGQPCQLPGGG